MNYNWYRKAVEELNNFDSGNSSITKEDLLEVLSKQYPNSSRESLESFYNHISYGKAGRFWTILKIIQEQ